jgi:hypothetical protein
MRYAILEVLPPTTPGGDARVDVAYRDMALMSANDARRAWNYQLSRQGGWMEVVEDTPEAIEAYTAQMKEFAFKRGRSA